MRYLLYRSLNFLEERKRRLYSIFKFFTHTFALHSSYATSESVLCVIYGREWLKGTSVVNCGKFSNDMPCIQFSNNKQAGVFLRFMKKNLIGFSFFCLQITYLFYFLLAHEIEKICNVE